MFGGGAMIAGHGSCARSSLQIGDLGRSLHQAGVVNLTRFGEAVFTLQHKAPLHAFVLGHNGRNGNGRCETGFSRRTCTMGGATPRMMSTHLATVSLRKRGS